MQIWAKCSARLRAESPPRQPGSSVEAIGSGQVVVRRARDICLCLQPAVSPWAKALTPLLLSGLIWKMGILTGAYVCVDCTAGYFKAARFT